MAKNFKHNRSAEELKEEITRSRERVARDLGRVRDELDLPRKIRRSFQRQPAAWIVAAVALGLVLTAVAKRKKKIYVDPKGGGKLKNKFLEAGFLLGVLKIGASLLKPVIVPFVRQKVSQFARGSHASKKWRV
jgi:hypothetical protein